MKRVYQKGQALLVLLVFMSTAIIVTTAAAAVTVSNLVSTGNYETSHQAYIVAESGMENALLRIHRDPNYAGETLNVTVGNTTGAAIITVTGSSSKTIVSEGVVGTFHRKLQVVGNYVNTVFTISSWSEIN